MPDLDGYAFMRRVRSQNSDIPAIALTAYARAEDAVRAIDAGYHKYIPKPVDADEHNRTQKEREQALQGFREGRYEVLVATDIAARGLDIAEVSHVVNFDVPQHPEDYIHRIGRTGRMAAKGDAYTLMVAEDVRHVNAIERFISQKIPRVKLENFDYRYTALFEEGKPGQPQGGVSRVRGARVRGGYFYGPVRGRR